jgi:hypothetical protein
MNRFDARLDYRALQTQIREKGWACKVRVARFVGGALL